MRILHPPIGCLCVGKFIPQKFTIISRNRNCFPTQICYIRSHAIESKCRQNSNGTFSHFINHSRFSFSATTWRHRTRQHGAQICVRQQILWTMWQNAYVRCRVHTSCCLPNEKMWVLRCKFTRRGCARMCEKEISHYWLTILHLVCICQSRSITIVMIIIITYRIRRL